MSQPVVPFKQFVLKVHSRCDLACDYCYVYQSVDQGWRRQPAVMAGTTVAWVARRIAEHAKTHQLPRVHVVLHGGEPLLAGVTGLRRIVETLSASLNGICDLDLRIHTNGIRLNEDFCEMFAANSVRVGVSIDGYRIANDRHRRYAHGHSSYDQVIHAINLLRAGKYRHLYLGLLCTIDLLNDPVATYEALLALDPPRIDFLLPHATWDQPPTRPSGSATEYADWLIKIFDRWESDGQPVGVRLFDSIIRTTHGADTLTEALGLAPSNLVVIETDGAYEQVDSLKASYEGAPGTGFDVFSHGLDVVAAHPGITARQLGLAGLCEKCQACPVVTSCGGGLYAHRYRSGSGFANPSVYCADLIKLIRHVRSATLTANERAPKAVHALPASDFDALAAGYGETEAVGQLLAAQYSLRRALLSAFFELASRRCDSTEVSAAWDILSRVDQVSPRTLEAVLIHPYVQVWLVHCLERLRSADGLAMPGAPGLASEIGHISAIAIAAAIRSGLDGVSAIPVRDQSIYLPTLGQLRIPQARQPSLAMVETTAKGTVSIRLGPDSWQGFWSAPALAFDGTGTASWHQVRQLTAPGLSVALEDTDPYRDCHRWPAAPRASDEHFAEWNRRFRDAWTLICAEHGAYSPGMAVGLSTVTPLSAPSPRREISATARNAFGAVAIALPADSANLALLLIHEFQHVKLGAILDLYDLFDPADARLFQAPWRDDPRPLEGLLQGTYAHVAVTEFWRTRMHAGGADAHVAASCFAHWRVQTATAIETLAHSGSLTPIGSRLVDRMRQTVVPWLDE
jgi:uncharacterized protein